MSDAADWLLDFLATGPRLAQDIFTHGKANGHTRDTIKRAKADPAWVEAAKYSPWM